MATMGDLGDIQSGITSFVEPELWVGVVGIIHQHASIAVVALLCSVDALPQSDCNDVVNPRIAC